MLNNIIIHQLQDEEAYPIAPSTTAQGVILDYGVSLQKQVDYYGYGAHLTGVVVDNSLTYRSNENDWSYVVQVKTGDSFFVRANQGNTGHVTFVKTWPETGEIADLMTGETGRRSYENSGLSRSINEDGYAVITHSTSENPNLNEPNECTVNGLPALFSKMEQDKVDYLERLSGQTEDCIDEIQQIGIESGYTASISELREKVDTLDNKVFPLKIGYTITATFSGSQYKKNMTVSVTEYPKIAPIITSGSVTKSVNDGSYKTIYTITSAESSFTDTIEGSRERISFEASTKSKNATNSATRYLCFYGPNSNSVMTSQIATGQLGKMLSTNASFGNPTIETKKGDYIWLIVPDYLKITQVKSSGFNVPLYTEDPEGKKLRPQTLQIGTFGRYKAYRTLNALGENKWNLEIT